MSKKVHAKEFAVRGGVLGAGISLALAISLYGVGWAAAGFVIVMTTIFACTFWVMALALKR